MKLTRKGQVTIPRELRQFHGLLPHTEVCFESLPEGVLIKPAGSERLRRLRKALDRSRGSADAGLTTHDVMIMTRGDD